MTIQYLGRPLEHFAGGCPKSMGGGDKALNIKLDPAPHKGPANCIDPTFNGGLQGTHPRMGSISGYQSLMILQQKVPTIALNYIPQF